MEVFAGALPAFEPSLAPEDPVELFTEWLLGAVRAGVREPHAMTLSTADADGNPAARVLILKDVSTRGWQFASHSGSPKGRDLAERPYAALTFYWPSLARQVRVRGPVVCEHPDTSAADFLARGPGARAETLLGRQSQPLADPDDRDKALQEAVARLELDPGLVAPGWTLYSVRPSSVEFLQGDKERRHTRLAYRASADGWVKELLWP
ncbi:pyridoxine/pyridoxamine 5'-phosphate oxidase [Actinacidiphila sp. bgisy160]|uniref:pyridoxine/pyridoxamine 5'-phosphate oxidase n=1 Tax=Actinacidiphila sp. bgisy160 TaxID=3413796 RepID=UPI003D72726E